MGFHNYVFPDWLDDIITDMADSVEFSVIPVLDYTNRSVSIHYEFWNKSVDEWVHKVQERASKHTDKTSEWARIVHTFKSAVEEFVSRLEYQTGLREVASNYLNAPLNDNTLCELTDDLKEAVHKFQIKKITISEAFLTHMGVYIRVQFNVNID